MATKITITKKRKKIIVIALIVLACLVISPIVVFSIRCLIAENELEKNFTTNKKAFYSLAAMVERANPIAFDIVRGDTIDITFTDTSITFDSYFIDSSYAINSNTKYIIDQDGFLQVIGKDTLKVTNNNWKVRFCGDHKDKRIDDLLIYSGWSRDDFNELVNKINETKCNKFFKDGEHFSLSYKFIPYYHDGGLHCFGHLDGYFDYLYTTEPDSFYWKNSLKHFENNFYGIEHWDFNPF